MASWWHIVVAMGLVGLAGAYEGRSLTRDTAWWAAPEPQWRSRILPALMPPPSLYWGAPQAKFRQLEQPLHHQQPRHIPLNHQPQQHPAAVPLPYQQQQQYQPQHQPLYYQQQPQPQQYNQQQHRARYLREPQDDPYRGYNPRQPAPWSVQVGTSLTVRDDDARGAASRRFYVQSQRDDHRWP